MSAGGNNHNLLVGLLVGGLLAAYAALCHYISTLPEGNVWAVLIAVVPMVIMILDVARRAQGNIGLGLAALASLAALIPAWPYLKANVSWVYFVQHVAINVSLGLVFARTLVGNQQPLCTFFASFVHPHMTPAITRYTRQVTVAWSLFFFCVTAASVLLFFLAPLQAWSVFANLLNWPLVGLMFLGEYQARRFFLPPEDRMGVTHAFRAYMAARRAQQMPASPSSFEP